MNSRQKINCKIDQLAASLRKLKTNFNLGEPTKNLATHYCENPDFHSAYEAAANDVEKWDKAHRPKDDGQGTLFREDAVIPTGKEPGARVFMKDARREDLVGWRTIEVEAFSARAIDYAQKIRYIDSRLKAWDVSKHQTLLDLEKEF